MMLNNNFRSIIGLLFISLLLISLEAGSQTTDTIVGERTTIKISEISIKSGEAVSSTERVIESLISDESIETINTKTDSIVSFLDSLLVIDRKVTLENENTRFLSNKIVFWNKYVEILQKKENELANEIGILNDQLNDFENRVDVWSNTKKSIEAKESESSMLSRIDNLLEIFNSSISIVQKKAESLLGSLNKTTDALISIKAHIDNIDKILLNKKNNIFVQNEPSVFSLDYQNASSRSFLTPIIDFWNTEVVELGFFLKLRHINLILQVLVLIMVIFAFKYIRKKISKSQIASDSFYRQMLIKILGRSVSTAIILGIFISSIFFPNRPELLKDFLVIIAIIPIVLIARTIMNKKFHFYISLFAILIFLNIVYVVFPPDNIYYMIIMLLVALIEIYILGNLFRYFKQNPIKNKLYNNLIQFIVVVHLGFALIGLFGLLYGSTTLAEVTLNTPVANAFSGLLLFSIIITINGIISFIIDLDYVENLNIIKRYGKVIKKRVFVIVNVVLIGFWISNILSVINIRKPVFEAIASIFTTEIAIGSASFTFGSVAMFFIVIYLSIVVSKIIQVLLKEDVLIHFQMSKGLPHTIAVMVRYSLVTIGVLLAITAVGMPLSSLTVLAGAFGVGIGFGLQNIFNNIVSGFILLFERPIQLGDTIEVGQLIGKVKSIGIRSSNVKTFEGADVIVPNGLLISNEVVNWTLSDQQRRIEVTAGVAYGSDPHKVKELFLQVLNDHPEILSNPEPSVFFKGLGDSSLDFRLLFWTSNYPNWLNIQSDIVFAVHDILNKEGIGIPFPQLDLHLKSVENSDYIINPKSKKDK